MSLFSIVIFSRDRAYYVGASIRTALELALPPCRSMLRRGGVVDVHGAAELLAKGSIRNLQRPTEQVRMAIRIGRG